MENESQTTLWNFLVGKACTTLPQLLLRFFYIGRVGVCTPMYSLPSFNPQQIYANSLFTNRPVADWAKSSGVKQFLFISSAGIYKPTDEPPHVEGV